MLLVVGEIIVDFTRPTSNSECKLRLGGITHAARGLWACDIPYVVAAVCPSYLVEEAKQYLRIHGCHSFIWLGEVTGSPNVMVISDVTEVSDQGYEDLLREKKQVIFRDLEQLLLPYRRILVFPGAYSVNKIRNFFSDKAKFSFDIAYDFDDFSLLEEFIDRIDSIIISTSSNLFQKLGSCDVRPIVDEVKALRAESFLLKENRGGSRLFNLKADTIEAIPAVLSATENSVGVGDVYSAVMLGFQEQGWEAAAWRGSQAATVYSQTTYPDDFRRDVKRALKLSVVELQQLGGTILPWHIRPDFQIYLAAPDFTYINKPEIEAAIKALAYHNFTVRRPVIENGELPRESDKFDLHVTYAADVNLLHECHVVFAVPLMRDPGTLVEMGMAMALNKPVITFDPRKENTNTMVIAGSASYSSDLDICLNALFMEISNILAKKI